MSDKTYYITHTIYVCVDIEAKNEEEALEKFHAKCDDQEWYLKTIFASECDTEAEEG